MIKFDYNPFFKDTAFIWDVGGGPGSSPRESAGAAKVAPDEDRGEDAFAKIKDSLKKAPNMDALPSDIKRTIEGVRAEVEKVSGDILQVLEKVDSGQVSNEIRDALKKGVRDQLGSVVRELTPSSNASIEKVRKVIDDLGKIVKVSYEGGKIHIDEVNLSGGGEGKEYDLHYKDGAGYGSARVGPVTMDGGASVGEDRDTGVGRLAITGRNGFRVELTSGQTDKGEGTFTQFGAAQKSKDVSAQVGLRTDQRGNLSGSALASANVGGGRLSATYSRDTTGGGTTALTYNRGNLTVDAVNDHGQSGFTVKYDHEGTYVSAGGGLPLQRFGAPGEVVPRLPVTEVHLSAGTPLPGGGAVDVNVGKSGDTPNLGVTARVNLLGGGVTSDGKSGGTAVQRPTLGLGVKASTDVPVAVNLVGTF